MDYLALRLFTLKMELTGNEKRKESCKKVGAEKKKRGHSHEATFNSIYGSCDDHITYEATADCVINHANPRGEMLIRNLSELFGEMSSYNVSLKSGKNLQFTLGRIDEITTTEDKLSELKKTSLWNKYLKKSESSKPADFLCYRFDDEWIFFKMDDVVKFITDKCNWRLLDTGRIKGDFADLSKKGVSQYLTYEYRDTHGSHFLGANCGKGEKFIQLLKTNLRHLVDK